jgi:hypothetical protein
MIWVRDLKFMNSKKKNPLQVYRQVHYQDQLSNLPACLVQVGLLCPSHSVLLQVPPIF